MEMLYTKLVFMLKLLNLFLWCLLVVFLILRRRLGTFAHVLADKENLAVFVVQVLRLDLRPSQATELFDDSADCQTSIF